MEWTKSLDVIGLTSNMDNNNLFDTIKQKEQDFIKTLKDIAEAAFITDSLDRSVNDPDMDDNQVDSDLSKVASEIAKSSNNLDDDNSGAWKSAWVKL